MNARLLVGLVLVATSIPAATAAMAPRFERERQLAAAVRRLSEVAYLMSDPIETIAYVRGEVRFVAGGCYVPVTVRLSSPSDPHLGGGGNYVAEIGTVQCR